MVDNHEPIDRNDVGAVLLILLFIALALFA